MISRDLQPPYPPSEVRAQRGGRVQVRVTIGIDGRVTAVEQISATSNAFWEATRTQALRRWRGKKPVRWPRPVLAVAAGVLVVVVGFVFGPPLLPSGGEGQGAVVSENDIILDGPARGPAPRPPGAGTGAVLRRRE